MRGRVDGLMKMFFSVNIETEFGVITRCSSLKMRWIKFWRPCRIGSKRLTAGSVAPVFRPNDPEGAVAAGPVFGTP